MNRENSTKLIAAVENVTGSWIVRICAAFIALIICPAAIGMLYWGASSIVSTGREVELMRAELRAQRELMESRLAEIDRRLKSLETK